MPLSLPGISSWTCVGCPSLPEGQHRSNALFFSSYLVIDHNVLSVPIAADDLTRVKWKSLSHVWLFAYSQWDSPGQNTGVGSLSLLQGIFPTQGSNWGLPHCRWILYQLSHQGSPRILEWVAYPSSSGSSQARSWTGVSCIAGGFFTNWAKVVLNFNTLIFKEGELFPWC